MELRMPSSARFAHSIVAFASASLVACSTAPTGRDLESVLAAEYRDVVRVENVQRVNGVAYPGGSGVPESYGIDFRATLVASGPITLQVSANLERALEECSRVKGIRRGHQPDPAGLAALADISTGLWRTDETRPANIEGSLRFIKSENGWQRADLRACLAESSVSAGSMPVQEYEVYASFVFVDRKKRNDTELKEAAARASADVRKGVSFEDIAGTYIGTGGNDLNWWTKSELDQWGFYEAALSQEIGRVSEPILTSNGFLIIKVGERRRVPSAK